MNRLRVLKKRANREGVWVSKHEDGYYIAWGSSFFDADCDGPYHSRREAYFTAARIALPRKKFVVSFTEEKV